MYECLNFMSDNVQIALMDVLALHKVTCYILAIVNYSVG